MPEANSEPKNHLKSMRKQFAEQMRQVRGVENVERRQHIDQVMLIRSRSIRSNVLENCFNLIILTKDQSHDQISLLIVCNSKFICGIPLLNISVILC